MDHATLDEWHGWLKENLDILPEQDRPIALAVTLEAVAPLCMMYALRVDANLARAFRTELGALWARLEGHAGGRHASAAEPSVALAQTYLDSYDGLKPFDALRDATQPCWQSLIRATTEGERLSSYRIATDCDEILYAIGYAYVAAPDRPGTMSSDDFDHYGTMPMQVALREILSQAVEQTVKVDGSGRGSLFGRLREAAQVAAGVLSRDLPPGLVPTTS